MEHDINTGVRMLPFPEGDHRSTGGRAASEW